MPNKVKYVEVEHLTYEQYLTKSIDRLLDVFDFLDMIEERVSSQSSEISLQQIENQTAYILESLAFLVEHKDDFKLNSLLVADEQILEVLDKYEEVVGLPLITDNSLSSKLAGILSSFVAQRVDDLTQALILKSAREGHTIHDQEQNERLESIDGFAQELWEYISDPDLRPAILISNADPFVEFEIDDVNSDYSVGRQVDSIGMITFGLSVGSAITLGNQSIEDIEDLLIEECGTALRPYMIALFENFPEVVDLISVVHFNDLVMGNSSHFSQLVAQWAKDHLPINKPCRNPAYEVVETIFCSQIQVTGAESISDATELNNHPFTSNVPIKIAGSKSQGVFEFSFVAESPEVEPTDVVKTDHFELMHLNPKGGLVQTICIN